MDFVEPVVVAVAPVLLEPPAVVFPAAIKEVTSDVLSAIAVVVIVGTSGLVIAIVVLSTEALGLLHWEVAQHRTFW